MSDEQPGLAEQIMAAARLYAHVYEFAARGLVRDDSVSSKYEHLKRLVYEAAPKPKLTVAPDALQAKPCPWCEERQERIWKAQCVLGSGQP